MQTSIAQEYYKLQEEWSKIDVIPSWKLAVWVAQYSDVDIIDKFMEIECSPIGIFNDIFFKFESVYQGNVNEFEERLFREFCSWFQDTEKKEMNLNLALYESGLTTAPFVPNRDLVPNAENLWNELLRLRSTIKNIDDTTHFSLYFPIVSYTKEHISQWFEVILDKVPKHIRLVTIDFAEDRKIKIEKYQQQLPLCVYLLPKLDMASAIKNEMNKDGGNYNTTDVQARFRKQVIKVMDSTTNMTKNTTPEEVKKLLAITNEIGTTNAYFGGMLIAAQAYYAIKNFDKSEELIDKALAKSEDLMQENDFSGYPTWKSCMLLKAALLYGKKDLKAALKIYDQLAEEATKQADAYYVMESRRLVGHIYYELNDLRLAFQNLLLALTAGAYLELPVRRQSTFLHVCYMSIFIANKIRNKEEVKELKLQIQEWLGDDWEELLQTAGVENTTIKTKKSIFF